MDHISQTTETYDRMLLVFEHYMRLQKIQEHLHNLNYDI